jgi:hypothetical protein
MKTFCILSIIADIQYRRMPVVTICIVKTVFYFLYYILLHKQVANLLHAGFLPGLFFDPEGGGDICSSEMSADLQRDTKHYIPEDRTLHNQLCENSNPI